MEKQATAIEEENAGFDEAARPVLSRKASDLLDGMFTIVETMYSRDSLYRDDYRISVVSSQIRKKKTGGGGAGWMGKGNAGALVKTITLHFWCLNPAVCFDELKNDCRTIVLTSGKLTVARWREIPLLCWEVAGKLFFEQVDLVGTAFKFKPK